MKAEKISKIEPQYAISKRNINKAFGLEIIANKLIKMIYVNFYNILHLLFTKCLNLACYPKPWEKAKVIFFYKQNKNLKDPKAYRSI